MNLIIHKRTYEELVKQPEIQKLVAKLPQVRETQWNGHRGTKRDEMRPAELFDFLGMTSDDVKWSDGARVSVEINEWPLTRCKGLHDLLTPYKEIYGVTAICHDLESWLAVCTEGDAKTAGKQVARTCAQAFSFITEYLRRSPGRRVYMRKPAAVEEYAYYVERMEYRREGRSSDDRRIPPEIHLHLQYRAHGHYHHKDVEITEADCTGVSAIAALAAVDLYVETSSRREAYLKHRAHYEKIALRVGLQCMVTGTGVPHDDDDRHGSSIDLSLPTPTRCVVDVYTEKSDTRTSRSVGDRPHLSTYFWQNPKYAIDIVNGKHKGFELDLKDIKEVQAAFMEDAALGHEATEIPLHPDVVIFSLRHHKRFMVHASQLTEYVYDAQLAKKLVMPPEHWALIEMLIENKEGFNDVVAGKGDGVIVLCEGAPGTGKTLTAEAFSEKSCRPLYSVQAAQLGLDAESLEEGLTKTFQRAARWNAIVLIDEADVYVARRGSDLVQNSIVGVFLRLLEYQPTTLFFTTNRADLVDDAILSRCIARVTYEAPALHEDQIRLWRTLAAQNNFNIPDGTLVKIAKEHPRLSGRDVKNLLKLALLVHRATKEPITSALITKIRKYKPTADWEPTEP